MLKKSILLSFLAAVLLLLGACANGNDEGMEDMDHGDMENTENTDTANDNGEMDHGEMNHSGSGEVPEGLQEAENPTYEVGSQAIITEGHMEGMEGATATIVGAYDTTVYAVSYDPTTGGERVENHKWVIHEEIQNAGEEPFEPGDEVKLAADHMEGMEGATATIDSAEQMTVYMVDFTHTTGGEEVKNHQWVVESELSPAE
ncbi:YdhK family protein [Bacillus litorisediminis]|uniref:YdhK family protein n=1 Tax=Bacillus litorisediminis TaxID=2922713 RepID=UPI001FAF893C|nr:YdhK family protein [Bacillus litorisediminis]